jgi:tetrahydromethanopterin S-methyltransferase subunit H
MEKPAIPDPSTVWETSMVTEEQIQSLVDRGLLRPKEQVGWRLAAAEAFPTEGTGETVVFLMHIKRRFGVPTGDFLHRLLHFYRIELVHLVPNSITIIATFIHL